MGGVLRLPPVGRCIGRDTLIDALTTTLLGEAPRPVPILGPAGIGKSTVTRAVLHRPEIAARYGERRWFVRLDASTTADAASAVLTAALGLDPGPDPRARALAELRRGRGLLVLDNLETPWEHERPATEALLQELAAVPGLSLVASVRAAVRPGAIAWAPAVHPGKLDGALALDLFCEIAGEEHRNDPALPRLLALQEGVPLAISLLAHAAEGNDPANLAVEWERRRTALLSREGSPPDRLSSWAASIELSMSSRRMTDDARRLAALLGVLPDGIAQSDLEALLPGAGAGAARVLAQVALAFFETGRLRMLAPIREHVAEAHPSRPEDLERAMEWYGELATTLGPKPGGPGGAEAVARLAPETANLDSVIGRGLTGDGALRWIDVAWALTRFMMFSGRSSPSVLSRAAEAARAAGDARREARCREGLADIALARSQHEEARARYAEAQALYRQLGHALGEADCIMSLGDIALERSQHETARARYAEAQPLYRQGGSVRGEANCMRRVGNIALERSQHEEARARYAEARPLYRQVGDVLGEANCIKGLGDIAFACSQHEEARMRYAEAQPLYRQVGSVRGEAGCIERLGSIALALSQHDEARSRYAEAQPLHQQVGSVLGEANCIRSLGDIALARSQHDEARSRYEAALELYVRIQEPYSIGQTYRRLARLASSSADRDRYVESARAAWLSIDRPDLVAELDAEFRPDA